MADTRKHRSEDRPNQTSATLDRRRADVTTSKPAARRKAASFGSRTATGVGRRRLSSTDHAGPTAETLAKLRPDPIVLLALRGDLGREHRVAVQEIRQAVAVVTQPVALRVSNPLRVAGPTHPLERESERNARLKRRYLSWIDELGRREIPTWPVFDVVIDELSCRQSDRGRRKRAGTARRLLVSALDVYCELSGWPTKGGKTN